MSSFISKRLSLVLLLCSYCGAAAITLLLHYSLAGPKLGPGYDVLLGFRSAPPVSSEILLIESDEVIEPGDMFSVLMILSEMGASDLVAEVPVLGSGSGRTESGVEFSYRINDEFNLLERNIRNLFEAIRLGLIPPSESPDYVENLVELAERGRDRLNAAIIRQDEAGSVLQAQAEAVFGRVISAGDLRVQSPSDAADLPVSLPYSRPRLDSDQIFRRIAPVIAGKPQNQSNPVIASFFEQRQEPDETGTEVKHIVYSALNRRWSKSVIEITDDGSVLVNRLIQKGQGLVYRFPLDRDGNILLEKPGKDNDFRRLNLDHFRHYEQSDRLLGRLLKDALALGAYAETMPERIPLILFEYAETLKEELLEDPDPVKKDDWINARADYIAGLDEFLYGPAEMTLVNGYEELIAGEGLDEEGITRLQNMRDELIRAFVAMREEHRDLIESRAALHAAIENSFCIMGPAAGGSGVSVTESSALLANALLTGRCISPGQPLHTIVLSLLVSLALLVGIHSLRPLLVLIIGIAAALLSGIAFGISFVVSAYWIHPLIPMAACLGGTLILTVSRFCISYGRTLRFRFAFAGAVNDKMLKLLIKEGRPSLTETECVKAALIAVKNPGLSGTDVRAAAKFRETFSRMLRQEGALILGIRHDTALACFGSPPERICSPQKVNPALRAVRCVNTLRNNPLSAEWHFGIEYGECVFFWSAETGYSADGHPVIRAGAEAALVKHFNVQAIIGESVKDIINAYAAKKLASLEGENVYELTV